MKLSTDAIFSAGMVLQRDAVNRITGTAPGGAEVKITFSGSTYTAAADGNGRFSVALPPVPACGEPREMTVSAAGETIIISDILTGDVFHITGQSNMELPLSRTYDPFGEELVSPDEPQIREFRVPVCCSFDDGEDETFSSGCWTRADSPSALGISAVGYHFAKELQQRIGVPVGLVNTSAGGSMIESRLPRSVLADYPEYYGLLKETLAPDYMERTAAADLSREQAQAAELEKQDSLRSLITGGASPEGESVSLPVSFGSFSGRLWFYNDFTLPESFPTTGAMLLLGTLTDRDEAFVNGVKVGETGYMYPPRYYPIPDGLLKPGRCRVSFLLDIKYGSGGVTSGKRWCIKAGSHVIDLTDGWTMCRAAETEPIRPGVFFQGLPLALYGKMTAPAFGLPFKGLVIYQGESKAGAAGRYRELFGRFLELYRSRCGYDIPVITTQLPEFALTDEYSWAELRQAQLDCCELPGVTMAVTLGEGEENDLHPAKKSEVGRRLALCAEGLIYGNGHKPVRCTGAVYSDGMARLCFSEPVKLREGKGAGFEAVYGERVCSVKVSAELIVTLPDGKPDELRYAWRSAPGAPTLYDENGLPVSPFKVKCNESRRT